MDYSIELLHVAKHFGEKTALADISLNVLKGEIFGLLGPSGAGKTTMIKILTGQLESTSGEARVFKTPVNHLTDEIYFKIGMVLDNSGLYDRLSCYDNLVLFSEIYNVPKTKITEVLEKVELSDAVKKPVSKLSKGMKQRLVLARAIMNSPELLFLDEPTSGLDPATAARIHSLVFELREKGATVFLTTHNMEEATKLCDNVALLNDGIIVEYGNPEDICRKYNSENKIEILTVDGKTLAFPNNSYSAEEIKLLFEKNMVRAIHSSEPNLETVFMNLTGRELL